METKTIKSTQLSKRKEPLFWEGIRKFHTMKRISYVIDSEGEGKDPVKSRLSTNSYLVPIAVGDFIIKIFIDKIGTGITILRVIDISNIVFPKVEVVKRKPSDSDKWIINEKAEPIKDTVEIKIAQLIEKSIQHMNSK